MTLIRLFDEGDDDLPERGPIASANPFCSFGHPVCEPMRERRHYCTCTGPDRGETSKDTPGVSFELWCAACGAVGHGRRLGDAYMPPPGWYALQVVPLQLLCGPSCATERIAHVEMHGEPPPRIPETIDGRVVRDKPCGHCKGPNACYTMLGKRRIPRYLCSHRGNP